LKRRVENSSRTGKVLLLSRQEIEERFSMSEALKAVEHAFKVETEG